MLGLYLLMSIAKSLMRVASIPSLRGALATKQSSLSLRQMPRFMLARFARAGLPRPCGPRNDGLGRHLDVHRLERNGERLAGLEQALEARQNCRPALRDVVDHD